MARPAPATRERQMRFIADFDGMPGRTLRDGIAACLARHGATWLTDEQIADITESLVADARFSQRLRVRNRQHLRSVA
jgi:hypothetical protein